MNARLIISFSRRFFAIWLNDSVSAPISSREVTGRWIWKFPAATARVPSTRRITGRESTVASPRAPTIPTTTMAALMTIVEFRAVATAWSIGFRLKPRYSEPTDTRLKTRGTAKSITLPCFGSTYGVTCVSPTAMGRPSDR